MEPMMDTPPKPTNALASQLLNGVSRLEHLGVIEAKGEDAAKFIHGQLTHDFSLLDLQHARLAAFCSPKGRMLASFIGFKRDAQTLLLVCQRDLLAATVKRLSMFVLRAKCRITQASSDYQILGLAGSAVLIDPATGPQAGTRFDVDGASVVNLHPAGTVPRQLWVAPMGMPPIQGPALELAHWHWGEVQSGVVTLSAAVADQFVPQMLNYESVDGVNFKKGCYPGQEVVARSQFRGSIKRRAYLLHGDSTMAVGDALFVASDPEQPVGLVAQAAPAPNGGFDAIASVQVSVMLASEPLHARQAHGPTLQALPLPYSLLDDI